MRHQSTIESFDATQLEEHPAVIFNSFSSTPQNLQNIHPMVAPLDLLNSANDDLNFGVDRMTTVIQQHATTIAVPLATTNYKSAAPCSVKKGVISTSCGFSVRARTDIDAAVIISDKINTNAAAITNATMDVEKAATVQEFANSDASVPRS
ncbi:hypothetical protein ACH5RR_038984 [Cinchona calisaya]|uniref:Uncharacterized protein n=1 Tax=Cinchona calisaya TaxID=153742 RepID=A0ABD2XYP2_9GENT